MSEVNTNATETTAAVVLSARDKLVQKIEAAANKAKDLADKYGVVVEQHKELTAELEALDAVANVKAGDRVDAVKGRGEKAVQIVNAEVLGVQEDEAKGKQIKVQAGSGFDTQVYVLTPAEIVRVFTAEELAAATAPVEEAAAE